jgi:hypothetical protein
MGLFSKKVELNERERADLLAATGLNMFTSARDALVESNLINQQIIDDSIENSRLAAVARDAIIESAKVDYNATIESDGAKIVSAQVSAAQNERALEALNGILGA